MQNVNQTRKIINTGIYGCSKEDATLFWNKTNTFCHIGALIGPLFSSTFYFFLLNRAGMANQSGRERCLGNSNPPKTRKELVWLISARIVVYLLMWPTKKGS